MTKRFITHLTQALLPILAVAALGVAGVHTEAPQGGWRGDAEQAAATAAEKPVNRWTDAAVAKTWPGCIAVQASEDVTTIPAAHIVVLTNGAEVRMPQPMVVKYLDAGSIHKIIGTCY